MNINSLEERHAMSAHIFEERGKNARKILLQAGAHEVIPDIGELPKAIDRINQRIEYGETP
jgi:hypothetical protein